VQSFRGNTRKRREVRSFVIALLALLALSLTLQGFQPTCRGSLRSYQKPAIFIDRFRPYGVITGYRLDGTDEELYEEHNIL